MIAHPQFPLMTASEYLEWEAQQPIKYEYINGEVYAMTGGTLFHNEIALNLVTALKIHLRGKNCRVFMADAKLGISEKGPFHYPDIMVSCDPRDKNARQVIYHPCLIVEVLSPSTEAYDRGQKFKNYRCLDSLQEYILISSNQINVECYRLNERRKWELTTYSIEAMPIEESEPIILNSIDLQLPISLIYENIDLEKSEV